jgi:hypothetical protein
LPPRCWQLKASLAHCKMDGGSAIEFPTQNSYERRLVYQFAEERYVLLCVCVCMW